MLRHRLHPPRRFRRMSPPQPSPPQRRPHLRPPCRPPPPLLPRHARPPHSPSSEQVSVPDRRVACHQSWFNHNCTPNACYRFDPAERSEEIGSWESRYFLASDDTYKHRRKPIGSQTRRIPKHPRKLIGSDDAYKRRRKPTGSQTRRIPARGRRETSRRPRIDGHLSVIESQQVPNPSDFGEGKESDIKEAAD